MYEPEEWILFIDSSKSSLKVVFIHNSNRYASVLVEHSVHLKECYEHLEFILNKVSYFDHKWTICGDLKVISMLLGQQSSYTKFPCFLSDWDSRDRKKHYVKQTLPIRKALIPGVKKVESQSLVYPKKILFPPLHIKLGLMKHDEAHFWLKGYINKQNCRIWSETNPQVYVETPLHPEKLTVWCALWAGGIIGPYFFKNDEGHKVTVNGNRYIAMISNFFIPEFNNHAIQELWFQEDGATCHTARATIDLLKDTFGDSLISRFGPVNWPPRSCDLTLLDYFLWGYVKSLVYADKPQTLDDLEDHIRRVIANIRPQMLEIVFENWTIRLVYIRASRGSPMPEIIFKM
ncbi:putative transposable element [Trichonephila clavipes]|nr:putative transposable element [Trichonephila clavipes]